VTWWMHRWVPRWWRTTRVLALVGDLVADLVGIGGGDLAGRLGGCVIALWRKKSQRPVRAFKANTNRTHLMERHIG
jgi:hypothetical protein